MRKCRRNITIVNNEIDYDKLAQAIVNAEEKKAKLHWYFWVFIVLMGIISVFFFLLFIAGLTLGKYVDALKMLMISLGAIFMLGASFFIGKTEDKNYIIGLGGLMFSFVSIVIAVIAFGG